jgi:hypothetical protein
VSAEVETLVRRARVAYERGRWRRAVLRAAPLVLLPAALAFWCAPPVLAAASSSALLLGSVALLWRGEGYGRSVLPGVLGGAPALALPALVRTGMGHVCHASACWNVCVAGCVSAGIAAGAVLWWCARREAPEGPDRARFLMAGAAVAAVTALPACAFAGLLGMGALVAGLLAATAPALARPVLRG